MPLESKLALGTVQFGLDYGINNQRGRVPREEAFAILECAAQNGIKMLDTAAGYGESEAVLGQYLSGPDRQFLIVSKLPQCRAKEVAAKVQESLRRLRIGNLYGYILHNFQAYSAEPAVWESLQAQKEKGLIDKIGFSLYYPKELETVLSNRLSVDLVQIPYSLFDQRFAEYLPNLKAQGIEVHVRSVFLQGLVFMRPEELTGELARLRPKLSKLRSLAEASGLSIASLCLNYVLLNGNIDRVVVGVDGIENFRELLAIQQEQSLVRPVIMELEQLREADENLILPINWQKAKVGAKR